MENYKLKKHGGSRVFSWRGGCHAVYFVKTLSSPSIKSTVKTLSGSANVVAVMIDRLNNKDILGCIAGDDTVFAVCRDEHVASDICAILKDMAV